MECKNMWIDILLVGLRIPTWVERLEIEQANLQIWRKSIYLPVCFGVWNADWAEHLWCGVLSVVHQKWLDCRFGETSGHRNWCNKQGAKQCSSIIVSLFKGSLFFFWVGKDPICRHTHVLCYYYSVIYIYDSILCMYHPLILSPLCSLSSLVVHPRVRWFFPQVDVGETTAGTMAAVPW